MKRSLSLRRSNSTVEQGSAKRQKQYTTRDISWEEQKRLGGLFKEVGEGSWPVLRIIDQRGFGKKRQYLIEWHPHPHTHEEFEPEWKPQADVSHDSVVEWQKGQKRDKNKASASPQSATLRRARQRRVIPNSSDTTPPEGDQPSDAAASPPGLESGSSVSAVEIAETQYPTESLKIKLPPLPLDKDDYDTIRSSQAELSSPDARINIISSLSDLPSRPLPEHCESQSSSKPSWPARRSPESSVPILLDSNTQVSDSVTSRHQPKALSTLAKVVQTVSSPIQDFLGSAAFDFATQLPFNFTATQSATSPGTSSALPEARQSRLKSPFQDSSPESRKAAPHPPTRNPEYRVKSPLARALRRRTASSGTLESAARIRDLDTQDSNNCLPGSAMASPKPDVSTQDLSAAHVKSPLQNSVSADEVAVDEPLFPDTNNDGLVVPIDSGSLPLIVHESIEEEPQSSTDMSDLVDSKVSSSQESLNQEREIETIDGIMIPTHPIMADYEHAIALPAEGKVKSSYDEIIKLKKKSILSFISRRGSPGTSGISRKKTDQRLEMLNLLQHLNDTTTHTDLGLDPSQHEYRLNSQENAAYSDYAGSKFTMLGHLIDALKDSKSSIVIFAQQGSLQALLIEYLKMKHVKIRCWDRIPRSGDGDDGHQEFTVDLLATPSDASVILPQKPLFVIAFDLSFSTSDSRFQAMRRQFEQLFVIHLLITNSAEHVDRCVPLSLPSNVRLKVVVRTAYLAAQNLGGDITYLPRASDTPADGRHMDLSDFQRAIRKSPNRRMEFLTEVIVGRALAGTLAEPETREYTGMPELKLDQLLTPPKISRAASRTPQPSSRRTQTPVSRATTPIGRKRYLDPDGENGAKRQRFTPVRDLDHEGRQTPVTAADELQEARRRLAELDVELNLSRTITAVAEKKQAAVMETLKSWREDHAELLKRFESGRAKEKEMYRENKRLNKTLTNMKERDEKLREEKASLRQQITELKDELHKARDELKSSGTEAGQLEIAREEARIAVAKAATLEKSLKTTKSDFEFTRAQYQEASKRAADLAIELKDHEEQAEKLKVAAGDSKRQLKAMNYESSIAKIMEKAEQFRLEVKSREVVIKKLTEENNSLKTRRGVQTRGSSVQPNPSPAPRSRQNSPAPGRSPAPSHLMPPAPSGSRASVLRNER